MVCTSPQTTHTTLMILDKQRKHLFAIIILLTSAVFMMAERQGNNHAPQQTTATDSDTVAVNPLDTVVADSTDTLGIDSIPDLPWPQSLQARIDTIMKKSSFLKTTQLGLYVYDLTADSALYAFGEKQTLRPASTMKVLTAVTALDKLGAAYLYKTRLFYIGDIIDSTKVLNGDVYIIGGMDPKLGSDDLRAFASSIKEAGIDTIRGSLYADRSMKDGDLLGEGWCWDDDNPVLSPLVYVRKDNLVSRLEEYLTKAGVYHDGPSSTKTCPSGAGAKELCTRTHTIEQVLQRMMKESDNLYAESMLYQIGLTQGKPSTAKKARAVETALLKKIGLASVPHRFADGSGLSLYNYVTAEMEVGFLRYAYENPDIYNYLYPSMPIAARDGTLSKRMKGTGAAGNVHAKTGTLTGISSLAGYCTASNGHVLCFSIICQGGMKASPAKTFQDKVCVAMCSPLTPKGGIPNTDNH